MLLGDSDKNHKMMEWFRGKLDDKDEYKRSPIISNKDKVELGSIINKNISDKVSSIRAAIPFFIYLGWVNEKRKYIPKKIKMLGVQKFLIDSALKASPDIVSETIYELSLLEKKDEKIRLLGGLSSFIIRTSGKNNKNIEDTLDGVFGEGGNNVWDGVVDIINSYQDIAKYNTKYNIETSHNLHDDKLEISGEEFVTFITRIKNTNISSIRDGVTNSITSKGTAWHEVFKENNIRQLKKSNVNDTTKIDLILYSYAKIMKSLLSKDGKSTALHDDIEEEFKAQVDSNTPLHEYLNLSIDNDKILNNLSSKRSQIDEFIDFLITGKRTIRKGTENEEVVEMSTTPQDLLPPKALDKEATLLSMLLSVHDMSNNIHAEKMEKLKKVANDIGDMDAERVIDSLYKYGFIDRKMNEFTHTSLFSNPVHTIALIINGGGISGKNDITHFLNLESVIDVESEGSLTKATKDDNYIENIENSLKLTDIFVDQEIGKRFDDFMNSKDVITKMKKLYGDIHNLDGQEVLSDKNLSNAVSGAITNSVNDDGSVNFVGFRKRLGNLIDQKKYIDKSGRLSIEKGEQAANNFIEFAISDMLKSDNFYDITSDVVKEQAGASSEVVETSKFMAYIENKTVSVRLSDGMYSILTRDRDISTSGVGVAYKDLQREHAHFSFNAIRKFAPRNSAHRASYYLVLADGLDNNGILAYDPVKRNKDMADKLMSIIQKKIQPEGLDIKTDSITKIKKKLSKDKRAQKCIYMLKKLTIANTPIIKGDKYNFKAFSDAPPELPKDEIEKRKKAIEDLIIKHYSSRIVNPQTDANKAIAQVASNTVEKLTAKALKLEGDSLDVKTIKQPYEPFLNNMGKIFNQSTEVIENMEDVFTDSGKYKLIRYTDADNNNNKTSLYEEISTPPEEVKISVDGIPYIDEYHFGISKEFSDIKNLRECIDFLNKNFIYGHLIINKDNEYIKDNIDRVNDEHKNEDDGSVLCQIPHDSVIANALSLIDDRAGGLSQSADMIKLFLDNFAVGEEKTPLTDHISDFSEDAEFASLNYVDGPLYDSNTLFFKSIRDISDSFSYDEDTDFTKKNLKDITQQNIKDMLLEEDNSASVFNASATKKMDILYDNAPKSVIDMTHEYFYDRSPVAKNPNAKEARTDRINAFIDVIRDFVCEYRLTTSGKKILMSLVIYPSQ
ncbi:hypothetical protein [Chitinivibrio alkaliphilus]|uniref:hypothetical protein n=1 Tax=Chitinivibrio alkaliphilus TaxID=1505232 RepID=UPI0012DD650F|nr:hypothetical protein [Chitinivibrio alkaliphilus]